MLNRRVGYGAIAFALFAVEVYIAARLAHTGFVRGSLGDILVVAVLYTAALSFREFDRVRLAAATFVFACFIELCQLFQLAPALGLHPTSVLGIVLGSTATWEDVLCYLTGAAMTLGIDLAVTRRRAPQPRTSTSLDV